MNPRAMDKIVKDIAAQLKKLKKVQLDPKAKKRGKRRLMKTIKKPGWQR
jgi:hypothetical protein